MLDVAIVGAGLSGLICAQQLRRSGYRVAVIEKSRGLGGRLATRRLQNTCADHGVRYLDEQGDRTRELIQVLRDRHNLHAWIDTEYTLNGELRPTAPHPRYATAIGMSAIAKLLATGLDIHRSLRVVHLRADQAWTLSCESGETIAAKAIALAVPAPQAVPLLESIDSPPVELLASVRAVEFDPCLTVIATYSSTHQAEVDALAWRAIEVSQADFAWIGIDSSKRTTATPVVVIHSSAKFAQSFLEAADLQPIGQQLLNSATALLPWLNQPEVMQIHRWRYAFVRRACPVAALFAADPLPIACCGDWCGGANLEAALRSGEAAAAALHQRLEERYPGPAQHAIAPLNFAEMMDAL